jgi:hypothetical protein
MHDAGAASGAAQEAKACTHACICGVQHARDCEGDVQMYVKQRICVVSQYDCAPPVKPPKKKNGSAAAALKLLMLLVCHGVQQYRYVL